MENEKSISELLDKANKHYTDAMIMFFISGLALGAGLTYIAMS